MVTSSHHATTSKPTWFIQKAAELPACLQALRAHHSLAFDLEFDSHRHAYGVTLCLIQVATPDTCYIIDPLSDIDLMGLFEIFDDARVEKIVHSPGEDLRLLHSLGCFPKNLFDTEVAAKLLNYEQTSLSAMLQAKLGYSLNKGQQRSNWLRRPLADEQIQYAADDVTGLHALKKILVEESEIKGLMPFLEEEQAALSTTIYPSERKDFFLKQGDVSNLSPYNQYVLNALFNYRDELARSLNRPAYQVIDEGVLRALASGEILPEELPSAKGVYGGFKNERFATQFESKLDAIHDEAKRQGLSKSRPPRTIVSEGRTARALMNEQREAVFAPIQKALVVRFGEHAARFILSNGLVTDLIKGSTSISKFKRHYKRELVRNIADELGISLTPYW